MSTQSFARAATAWFPSAGLNLATAPPSANQQVQATTAEAKPSNSLFRAKKGGTLWVAEGHRRRAWRRGTLTTGAWPAIESHRRNLRPCRCCAHLTPALGSSSMFVPTPANQCQLLNMESRRVSVRAQASAASAVSSEGGDVPGSLELTPIKPGANQAPEELEMAREAVRRRRSAEKVFETIIVNCRFFTLAGVIGSLTGSLLCFLKGSYYVSGAVVGYVMMVLGMPNRCKVVLKLIEALDTYLVGTVMLIFGMGLYELFVMKLDGAVGPDSASTLFGLFPLEKRPAWLAIKGLDDLKTKLGHVIVMILLVGMFEKSKIVQPTCSLDLFLTAGSVLLCAGSLFLLSRLKPDAKPGAETAGLH